MTKNGTVRTREQVKADLEAQGVSASEWARKNGFPPLAVHQVLSGFAKGKRGQAHRIAVALGIKARPKTHAA